MSETRTTYHHGALRDELITACVRLIEAEGIGAVSLRRVARAAGVSPGAPYHHFADRSALLAAISVHGHELLLAELTLARERATSPVLALTALIETYVDFTRRHPAHMRLMLRPELFRPAQHPESVSAAEPAVAMLTEVVQECQRAGHAPPGDPFPLVAAIWAMGIGIATLRLDGPLEGRCLAKGTTPEALTRQITTMLADLLTDR